jgi:hypothetical protein
MSCFRNVRDGPLGEGVRTPNLGKSLQCMGYSSCSGPYIIGIALAEYTLVREASIPALECICTWDGWYGNVMNPIRRC